MFILNEQGSPLNAVVADVQAALAERAIALFPPTPDPDASDVATVVVEWRRRRRVYAVEVHVRPTSAWVAAVRSRHRGRLLLLARQITTGVAEQCRALDVHFADAAGNVFLDWGRMVLDVEGRRGAPVQPDDLGRPLRAFQPSGLKVVFAMMNAPDLRLATYREIAEVAGVSVGTVHGVVRELTSLGHVEEPFRGFRRLHRGAALLDRWVEAYTLALEPRLVLGRFDGDDPFPWLQTTVPLEDYDAQWGGESAALRLGADLRPGHAVVYVRSVPQGLLRRFRLRGVRRGGTVTIRERFWRFEENDPVVPASLVYADLVASGDPRQQAAARELRTTNRDLRHIDSL